MQTLYRNRLETPQLQNSEKKGKEEPCCLSLGFWSDPSKDALPVSYCHLNSMHGLKYVAEPGRHFSERLFWLIAFLIGVGAAAYMISTVWENYRTNPVIVSFQPTETDVKDIPFPAITICNMNLFSRSLVEELQRLSEDETVQVDKRNTARIDLQYIRSICRTTKTYSQVFDFAHRRGKIGPDPLVDKDFLNQTDSAFDLMTLLVEHTIPCDDIIQLCVWSEEKRNCSEFFHPIITEYGKCCTFNLLPAPLLLSDITRTRFNNSIGVRSKRTGKIFSPRWNESEINKWKDWDYTNDGFILQPHQERPFRQNRAGIPFGLSLLIDGKTDEYFCPVSDSQGFRLVLHTSLEMPPVRNWGVAIELNKEIFLEITPDLTLSDPKVANFPHDKRKCFFQSEKTLQFYSAYTTSNCLNECIANKTADHCGCALFYMPRHKTTRICSTIEDSKDFECSQQVRVNFAKNYKLTCKLCDSLCTDIFYRFDISQAELQNKEQLWHDPKDSSDIPKWANSKVSILHIYFAFDSFVPKVRNELYATVDLIANTGGLLGLCLGFSALSAVEFVYFFTMRVFFVQKKQELLTRQWAQRFVNAAIRHTGWGWKDRFDSGHSIRSNVIFSPAQESKLNNVNQQYDKSRNIKMEKDILSSYPSYNFDDENENDNNNFSATGPQYQGHQNLNGSLIGRAFSPYPTQDPRQNFQHSNQSHFLV